MNILSDPKKDVRSNNHYSGGYEWWYFDGISEDGRYSFVVIFYEGNPFSTRYNALLMQNEGALPSEYPAISISIYEDEEPIYYSFTEFDEDDCTFSETQPLAVIGDHKMEGRFGDKKLIYSFRLKEKLPSGDAIDAKIKFSSNRTRSSIFSPTDQGPGGHKWNLVQPRAEVSADIQISAKDESRRQLLFEGSGYHDHNTGQEPMRNEFTDWYWGRFHFDYATLVYYVMNRRPEKQHRAWLISRDNGEILQEFDAVSMVDEGLSLFGLKSARKIGIRTSKIEAQVQQSKLLDNGPFYQRFKSDGFLRIPEKNLVNSTVGITEYIRPARIQNRLFWPLLNMRIRYKEERPHWVQKSKKLYRWTW